MAKQTKQKDEPRRVGPKFARNVIPDTFQIRRPSSPMAELLDEASKDSSNTGSRGSSSLSSTRPAFERPSHAPSEIEKEKGENLTPVKSTPVKITGVGGDLTAPNVIVAHPSGTLPNLTDFLDHILPRFPPARQAILLRLYRWSEGKERSIVVSTPRLAAKTNMDEKSCRAHLHSLIADGFLVRSNDGDQIAKFGGSDRGSRGLILKLSPQALLDLLE